MAKGGSKRAVLHAICGLFLSAASLANASERRPPIVIIPGAPGTELYDGTSGERVWPNARSMWVKNGDDRLALPYDDPEGASIVAGPLLRKVHVAGLVFHVHAYDGLEEKLRALGYREGDWYAPQGEGEYFYFSYDWRQSVETSGRRFARALAALYDREPRDTPPAIVLGHSLGGLIARYTLMYGDVPLGTEGPLPEVNWSGARHIGNIFLVATPNEGTFLALERLQKGIFYRHHHGAFSPETLFSYPSVFDMIPEHLVPLVDADGHALPFNLRDADDWERLGWSVIDPRKDSAIPYAVRRGHLDRELTRARRLWTALGQLAPVPNPVPLSVVAGLSGSVQRTALVTADGGGLKVRFDAPVSARTRFKALLYEPGDEMVPARSLFAEGSSHDPAGSLCFVRMIRSKKKHEHLLSSPELLDALDELLK